MGEKIDANLQHASRYKKGGNQYKRYSYPYPIVISKAFHHAVRKGMLCLDLDEDTKKKNHR
eukprot:4745550-Pleurochrysis_carterae.AAC.1